MTKEREALELALEALMESGYYDTTRQREAIAAIKDVLAQPAQQPVAPIGYVLVPIEPTMEMMQAAVCELTPRHQWAAFLSAAPELLTQPEQEPNGYVQTVIEALYENGDPVSVDAAELLQRITAQPEQNVFSAPCLCGKETNGWCMANSCAKAGLAQPTIKQSLTVDPQQ